MYIEQLYTDCLSEAAYYVESGGEAVIIDPLRDIQPYIDLALSRKAKIKYVLETHFHADFVSGHIDLADRTGATIVFGPGAEPDYPVYVAKDRETFNIGQITIEVLHTPGHTMESTCYLLHDDNQKPHAVFTGDTLFIGDVGRPDLMGGSYTKEELASHMYDSLNRYIKTLDDDVIVYPAHGPGSSCGKQLGPATSSTIGEQKATNYALREMTKEEFIQAVTENLGEPPRYFSMNARINKIGYEPLEEILDKSNLALSLKAFQAILDKGGKILDSRDPSSFEMGFIRNSINIGLDGRFAEWVGKLILEHEPVLLITPERKEEETILRMARIGYENVIGYLNGGVKAWQSAGLPIDMIISIDTEEFELDLKHETDIVVLDVREPSEYQGGHVENAHSLPLPVLPKELITLDPAAKYYLYCQTGYRSIIAASMMKQQGFSQVKNVTGGFDEIAKTRITVTQPKPRPVSS